jgi:anti-sigma regulatory factor (Ser/Thr protein kinase)
MTAGRAPSLPTAPLGITAQATPWIALGVGLVVAVGSAITVAIFVRRQRKQRAGAESKWRGDPQPVGPPSPRPPVNRTRTFLREPGSVHRARTFVAEALRDYPEDVVDRARLGISELATNAIRHAGSGFTVNVTTTEARVRIEVTDTGEGKPEKRNPGPRDHSGRGLQMIETMSDHWEVSEARPAGKSVAFVMSLAPEDASSPDRAL